MFYFSPSILAIALAKHRNFAIGRDELMVDFTRNIPTMANLQAEGQNQANSYNQQNPEIKTWIPSKYILQEIFLPLCIINNAHPNNLKISALRWYPLGGYSKWRKNGAHKISES